MFQEHLVICLAQGKVTGAMEMSLHEKKIVFDKKPRKTRDNTQALATQAEVKKAADNKIFQKGKE